jgi:phosphoadenylyl-sulfate reductase (thioredoxin)
MAGTTPTVQERQETHDLMIALEEKYAIKIERFYPDPQRLEKMLRNHGEYLFFDSREKQELCCAVRKVEPNERALETVDVWITGLRRDQSKGRQSIPKIARVERNGRAIIKIAPLMDWTEQQVTAYMTENEVYYNRLYDKGYTSIGCAICSTPTLPDEDKRAGRWRWWNHLNLADHKECGIHAAGSGI